MKMKPSASRWRLGQGPPQEVLTMLVSGWGRGSAWTMLVVEQKLWSPKDKLTATPQPRHLRCSQRCIHNYATVPQRARGRVTLGPSTLWLGISTPLTHQRCGECQASRRGRALLRRGMPSDSADKSPGGNSQRRWEAARVQGRGGGTKGSRNFPVLMASSVSYCGGSYYRGAPVWQNSSPYT